LIYIVPVDTSWFTLTRLVNIWAFFMIYD